MTSPRWAVDIGGTRWYRHPTKADGEPRWRGVTGTIAALPKEAIPRWAAKSVAEYAFDHREEWSKLPRDDWTERIDIANWSELQALEASVAKVGTIRKSDGTIQVRHQGAVSLLKNIPWQIRDQAAAKGSEVHSVVDKMLTGEDYRIEAETFPWIASAQEYIERCRPRPLLTEVSVYNDTHLYAGSADFLGKLEAFPELGDCVLGDYKTGRGVYPDMGVQMAAYAMADYYLDDQDREQPWPQPTAAVIIHLGPEGFTLYRAPLKKIMWRAFLAALEIRRWESEVPSLEKIEHRDTEPSWDQVWREQKRDHLFACISALPLEERLALSQTFLELGLPTRMSDLDDDQLLQALSLVEEDRAPSSGRPAQRPMP